MTDFGDKYSVLRDFFGHSTFREGQESVIDAVLSGRDTLAVMPTGAGKSMCYQIPALMFDGITIVISPLISLMKDQVNSLIQSGVRAAYLNSSLTMQQYDTAVRNASKGMYKVIYVAPERLATPSFQALAARVKIDLVAVDEAHCVSQWGQDFRPSYLKIPEFLKSLNYRPVVGAFTATATDRVRQDVIKMLGLSDPFCLTTGFDRKNLYFGVMHESDKYSQVKKILGENKGSSGIIYCSTRKNVEKVCQRLNEDGFACTRYHAGLSDEERRKNQEDFIYDRVPVIAATNAFGMGIDKSNVSFVIHYNMPKNIENYYQEAGRAGRDGNDARCILLYSGQDIVTNRFMIENSNENPELTSQQQEELRQNELAKLKIMTDYCNTGRCLRQFILDYFGEQRRCQCENCSNCLGEHRLTDVTLDAQKILSCIYRLHQRDLRFGIGVISQILKGSQSQKVKDFGLQSLSTYGIMKDSTEKRIRAIGRFLTAEGYAAQGDFQTLTLTAKSAKVLKGEEKIMMNLPAPRAKRSAERSKTGVVPITVELFERLRGVRSKLAQSLDVPAYIVFSDAVLRDMCLKKPRNLTELLEVSGVGKAKQERYGKFFIEEIRSYLAENKNDEEGEEISGDIVEYVCAHAHQLRGSDNELSLTQLCDDMLSQLGVDGDRKLIKNAVKLWLLKENYVCEKLIGGKKELAATILTEEAAIVERQKISSAGRPYNTLMFPKDAQNYIYLNLPEIAENMRLSESGELT